MSWEEQGIFNAQADGLRKQHDWTVAYLDDRIFVIGFAAALLVVFVVWLSASSPLLLYGSLGLALLVTVLWGVARIARINRIEAQRKLQVAAMQSDGSQRAADS